jgi:hypothetical protein
MEERRYIETLFKISAKIGKNDTLLDDIKKAVVDYYDIDILVTAIKEGTDLSVIQYLAEHVIYRKCRTCINLQHVYGIGIKLYMGIYEYLNILYHTFALDRPYYKCIAKILGYKIIQYDYVRQQIIDKLLMSSQ